MLGDFYLFKNGTIGRVIKTEGFKVKLRKISSCKGIYSSKERIGNPYTYQVWMRQRNLEKVQKIGTEKLLHLLYFSKETKLSLEAVGKII